MNFSLSRAVFCASSSDVLISLKSLIIVDNQVVGWPPHTFFENVLFASQYAFLADVSSGSLIKCPNQASLRLWIVSDQGSISHTLYSLLLVIHLVLTLWRKKSLLNESIFLVLEKTKKNVGEPRRYVCKVTKE